MRALAELVGVSKVTIWKWEKGDSEPQARLIPPLAKALNVPPIQLRPTFKGTGNLPEQMEAEGQDQGAAGARGQAEGLAEVIAKAKQMIADASGVGPKNITISIEY